jgi:hypothetical protein
LLHEEEARIEITETEIALVTLVYGRLIHDRQDPARDQVPVLVQLERDDRLDVEDVLFFAERPDIGVGVVLERDRNQIGDRVLRLLLEIAGVLRLG